MRPRRAALEDWMRDYYFDTRIDLGSSGVQCWSIGELRELLDIEHCQLDGLVMDDSPSYGGPALRQAIADRYAGGAADHVMATHGSTEAIFLALNSVLSDGDEVIAVDPGYHSFYSVAEAVGCQVRPWKLRPERGFVPDLDELSELVTPRTRMVVVNFPNNPTGATLAGPQFEPFLDIVAKNGIFLLWDAAFAELTYDTEPLPDPALRYDRCVSVGTMSKAYGLPGTRVGWCIGQPDTLASFLPLRDVLTICLSPIVEFFAERAIAGADRILRIRREQARRNLHVLSRWASENDHFVEFSPPSGGVTAFPRFPGFADADVLCRYLGSHHDVLLVPGSSFGHQDRVRLGFGGSEADFRIGLGRLRAAFEEDELRLEEPLKQGPGTL
jgi:capreomycidine synthase